MKVYVSPILFFRFSPLAMLLKTSIVMTVRLKHFFSAEGNSGIRSFGIQRQWEDTEGSHCKGNGAEKKQTNVTSLQFYLRTLALISVD